MTGARIWLTSWLGSYAILASGVSALVLLGGTGPNSLDHVMAVALVQGLLAVAFYVFVGTSGILSFGQLAFAALGAYAGGILSADPQVKALGLPGLPEAIATVQLPPAVAVLAAGLLAAVVAAVLAVPLMRLSGLAAGLATIALLFIARVVAVGWNDVTRGTKGLGGIPTSTTVGSALLWFLVALAVGFGYAASANGVRLRASRQDEAAARALGVHVERERALAFIMSAGLMGVGGALYAQLLGTVTPNVFFLGVTFVILSMCIVGGIGSLSGAVVGAVVLSGVTELLRRVEAGDLLVRTPRPGLANLVLAVLLIVLLRVRPEGLVGEREVTLPGRRRWSPTVVTKEHT